MRHKEGLQPFTAANGKITGECRSSHNQYDFIAFLDKLNQRYGDNKEIHIILDNFRAHKTESVMNWLEKHPNWKFHFTPTYSSWINQVECWFSIISRQCIRRGVFDSVKSINKKYKIVY